MAYDNVKNKTLSSKQYVDDSIAAQVASLPPGPTGPAGPSTYDLHNFINGKPTVQEILMRAVMVRAVKILAGCPGSFAFCSIAPTLSFDIAILKNGVQVGTLNFAVNATSGVFTLATDLVLNPGDQFAMRCVPASQDASLSDLTIAILANTV